MSTWLFEFGLGVFNFLILAPVLLLPLIRRVYARYGRFAFWPTALAAGTALYASGVIAFVFFPLPEQTSGFCDDRQFYEYWRPVPFTSIGEALQTLSADGLVQGLRSPVFLQVFFNVLLFVPLGFLLAYVLRKSWWVAGLAGFAGSVLIEVTQGTAVFGIYECPYRVAEVDDVILNTSGALLGWGIGWLLSRVWRFREPEPVTDLDDPTLRRRSAAVLLDLLNLAVMSLILSAAVLLLLSFFDVDLEPSVTSTVGGLSQLAVFLVALVILPAIRPGQTPGKRAIGLVVVDLSGAPAGKVRMAGRALIRYGWALYPPISSVLWLLLVVDLVVARIRPDNRTLLDMLTGTRVITQRRQVAGSEELTVS